VLGLECVTGSGDVVRGGGRVTKNVAGFDLSRLFTGSWGTLGVVTEITVRLRARPLAEATLAMQLDGSPARMGQRFRAIRDAAIEPMALELVNPRLAAALGAGDAPVLLVRLGGNADSLRAQRALVLALGDTREIAPTVWDALRDAEPPRSWVWRMSDLPSRIVETWQRAESLTAGVHGALIHAAIGRGVVRCIASPAAGTEDALATTIDRSPFGGTTIVERATPGHWPARASRVATDPISRRIRAAFDPHGLLNPGILGEGVA
jgi:glycolate oxidase FAD binding subunit